jgi:hypothetical protein
MLSEYVSFVDCCAVVSVLLNRCCAKAQPPTRQPWLRSHPICESCRLLLYCCCVAPAALAFRGIGFFDVGLAVFTGRLGWLADRIVPCGPKQAARSRQEWVQLLQHRLQPVTRVKVA